MSSTWCNTILRKQPTLKLGDAQDRPRDEIKHEPLSDHSGSEAGIPIVIPAWAIWFVIGLCIGKFIL